MSKLKEVIRDLENGPLAAHPIIHEQLVKLREVDREANPVDMSTGLPQDVKVHGTGTVTNE